MFLFFANLGAGRGAVLQQTRGTGDIVIWIILMYIINVNARGSCHLLCDDRLRMDPLGVKS